jgi:hypothetical protein|uniref:Uncharacterized protein n=1 Tax=Mimiviridae sp. ChoanoV1 TaxID=2596887 RepID=A0A5B8HVT0_9VIRU|nr:hypothetical protein 1_128 [Mimiviridae sp. ChoanoV1]
MSEIYLSKPLMNSVNKNIKINIKNTKNKDINNKDIKNKESN